MRAPPRPRAPERAPPSGARCERLPGAREGRPSCLRAQQLQLPIVTERTILPCVLSPEEQIPAVKLSLGVKNPQCTPSTWRGPRARNAIVRGGHLGPCWGPLTLGS